jgi:hypothetical protein
MVIRLLVNYYLGVSFLCFSYSYPNTYTLEIFLCFPYAFIFYSYVFFLFLCFAFLLQRSPKEQLAILSELRTDS